MTEPGRSVKPRRFLRFSDPRGRDIPIWTIFSIASLVRLTTDDDQSEGWLLWLNILLLVAGLVGFGLAAFRLWKHINVPSPDECSTCGHYWGQHAIDRVCNGCAYEIEHGIEPRVPNGCQLTPPVGLSLHRT